MKCPFLIGEKIYLRPLNPEDLEGGYLGWINDPEVNRFLMSGYKPTSFSQLKEYYEKVMKSQDSVMFAIVDKKTDKHIGNIKMDNIDWIARQARCGRMIGDRKYWGKGCGTETMRLIIDYAFNTLNLNRIYNRMVVDNVAAVKSCEKVGMKKEGVFSQCRFSNGRYKDVIQMAITRDRYNSLKNKDNEK